MPRPTRARTSLPSHSRAAKLAAKLTEVEDAPSAEPAETVSAFEEEPIRPPSKQKKADKQYAKREALLAKITAGASPYSKSHNRRAKRAARPSENLVTNLTEVEDVLEQLRVQAEEEEEEQVQAAEKVVLGGKGQEKLTAKKRQRVLTDESARLPAVLSNPAFASNPFATIRTHTLNTLSTLKSEAASKKGKSKGK